MQKEDIRQQHWVKILNEKSCGLMQKEDIRQYIGDLWANGTCCGLMQKEDIRQSLRIDTAKVYVVV